MKNIFTAILTLISFVWAVTCAIALTKIIVYSAYFWHPFATVKF